MTLMETRPDIVPAIRQRGPRQFNVIPGEAVPRSNSGESFDRYFELRIAAGYAEKIEGAELTAVQEDVRSWLTEHHPDMNAPGSVDDYRTYSIDVVKEKIGGLVDFLKANHSNKISGFELDATEAFIEATFAMYKDKNVDASVPDFERDGSFAFVVPARMSRKYPEYGQEVEPVIPALRYVPKELRAWIMRGCPPFIIDRYKPDEYGKRGYLIYAPVTEDMKDDLGAQSMATFIHTARSVVNDAVDFARDRLGVRVVGLGATLPKVTDHGRSIKRADVVTTTGHGGTAELICKTIDKLTNENPGRIGFLGLGYIGAAAAGIVSERFRGMMSIFDTDARKVKSLLEKHPEQFHPSPDAATLIRESDVIVSAITNTIKLKELGISDMRGKVVADDSQPASFNPREVEAMGGTVAWIIGRDGTGRISRTGYDYGTMVDGRSDLFGCEAEAAVLARYWSELEASGISPALARKMIGGLALREPVTEESAGRIGELFAKYGIVSSELQAFGRRVYVDR